MLTISHSGTFYDAEYKKDPNLQGELLDIVKDYLQRDYMVK
jgi:hypothetical protein